MPLFSDIKEIKALLEIDPENTEEDRNLGFYNDWASAWISEYLNRPNLFLQSRTEYYDGTGTQKLQLNSRPVYLSPAPQVYLDEQGYFGQPTGSFDATNASTQLVLGTDFVLDMGTDSGGGVYSRKGILVRIRNLWPKPAVRQVGYLSSFIDEGFGTIKVVYTGGYSMDTLPGTLRMAANTLISRMRGYFPIALELTGESYEERSISWAPSDRDYLMGTIKPLLNYHRNWKW